MADLSAVTAAYKVHRQGCASRGEKPLPFPAFKATMDGPTRAGAPPHVLAKCAARNMAYGASRHGIPWDTHLLNYGDPTKTFWWRPDIAASWPYPITQTKGN